MWHLVNILIQHTQLGDGLAADQTSTVDQLFVQLFARSWRQLDLWYESSGWPTVRRTKLGVPSLVL